MGEVPPVLFVLTAARCSSDPRTFFIALRVSKISFASFLDALIVEALMRGADHHDIGPRGAYRPSAPSTPVCTLPLCLYSGNIGIVIRRFRSLLQQVVDHIECRALPIVVDVVLVGHAENQHLRAVHRGLVAD